MPTMSGWAVRKSERVSNVSELTEVAFVSVKPDGKTVDIAGRISRTPAASDGGEAEEDGSLLASLGEEGSAGDVGPVGVGGEGAVGSGTTGVHSALGNTLVVEVLDLLAEDEVLEERRAAGAGTQAVLVGEGAANIAGEVDVGVVELELGEELVGALGLVTGVEAGVAGGNIASANVGAHVGAAGGGGGARKGGGKSNGREKHGR